MKVMAIDLGDARTGVAVSDALGMLTGSTSVIESWNKEKTAQLVAEAYRKSGAERLVMGFPRNMDGSEGLRADLYREFAAKLEELLGEKIVLWDERRTTIEAIRFCLITITTAKNARKPSTRLLRPLF